MKINFGLKFLIVFILIILTMSALLPMVNVTSAMSNEYMKPDQFDSSYNQLADTNVGGISVGGVLRKGLGIVLTILRIVAVAWAIIMAVAIAIKYMTGSARVKSQLKTDMPTYAIGAVLLFGAAGILTLLQYFVDEIIVI